MAEIDKVIRKGNTLTNIVEQSTGEYVTYNLVTEWVDGTAMTDAKCDGKWFRKHGSEYFRRVVDPNVPYNVTINEIRTSIGVIPYLFKRIVTTDRWQEGEWELIPGSSASDNTGTVLVTDLGFQLRRIYEGDFVNVAWFGAFPDNSTMCNTGFNLALAASDYLTGPVGTYLFNDTVVLGNFNKLEFPGSSRVTLQLHSSFPTTNKKPLLAFNSQYANPANNAFQISRGYIGGVTIRGNAVLNANGIPTESSGPAGVDITWTKDDILIENVYFREITHGCVKRDPTWANICHWGIRIIRGGAY